MKLEDRLKRKLLMRDACLIWSGSTTTQGYGLITEAGKRLLTHRVAYELATNISPIGKVVRHSCDTPACCNPSHLSLGTQMDNRQDMLDRGRANPAKGEDHVNALLNEEQVIEIRQRYISGETNKTKLSADYSVSRRTIADAINRKTWKHVNP